ncbi:chemotaxis protein CheR [Mangrovactinospora gilvigrisea]|uniref:protein-glutamate O-methyltransferase n=1 Tax=Mangrovactinospora gilvigrisea TaxID=1428644 RepID=A0A1J7BC09_9ACTN|nr:CheR family methyltransferase [Mangrovactinospora gilvigrisea]OIV36231.1 chemotaxis protein CheR [Mangrovactinospora gilvigrisea]
MTTAQGEGDAGLEKLLEFLRDSRGFDFTGYRRTSLGRRIRKRMSDAGVPGYQEYRDLLEADPSEFATLFTTILINVTSFLRDGPAWENLRTQVVPELVADVDPDEEIRVWSAGCSSGEEAYSLAMVFAEALGVAEAIRRVKIYGTDVDEDALRDARSGLYGPKALEPLPEELREKYFEPNGGRFAFRSDLRRRVIFGRHDITRDAPISRLNLLVCRNTLMYFNAEAQARIVDRFHFALRERGVLFLGKAEMLLNDGERFEVVDMAQRFFRRLPGEDGRAFEVSAREPADAADPDRLQAHARVLRDQTLEASPVATITVDGEGLVVQVNQRARELFGLSESDEGQPFRDLEVSYRPVELRSLIEQAMRERRTVRVPGAEWRGETGTRHLDIVVQPLTGPAGTAMATALVFTDVTVTTRLKAELKQAREELETAYEELQSTNEELETTNEELQSSIEELETTNEELQSTNEELETTNEELQSTNEELETINDELRTRSDELDEVREFLEGVMGSIAAAVVVLDSRLRVRSWNTGATELWGLRPDEVRDELFFDLDFGLPTAGLREMVDACLSTGRRTGPQPVQAVNRIGRSITCMVSCSRLSGNPGGVVLLMEREEESAG